jgi:8-oxo-dGTP pyrophosphatase MutT (NUDIX family)
MAGEPSRVIGLDAVRRALREHRPGLVAAPGAQPAAVALVLLETGQGLETLFIRRAVRAGDPWSGQVALPGGRRAAGDADLLATAIRETREETGVELSGSERLGALDDLHPQTPTLPPVVVRPFVFALGRRPALVPSDEVERAFWVPLARLAAADARRSVTLTVRGEARTFAAYLVDEELIWGMTERILTPFLRQIGLLDQE